MMSSKKYVILLIVILLVVFSCSKKRELKWKYDLGETLKVQTDPLYISDYNIIVTWRIDVKKLDREKQEGEYVVPKVNTFGSDIEMELQNKKFYANLVALNANNGKEVWKTVSLGSSDQNLSSPSYYNGNIYVGSDNNFVSEINASNGKIKWQYDTGSWVYAEVFVNENYILAGNEEGYVFLWDRKTKKLMFKKKIGYIEKKWIVKNGFIYGSSENKIYKLNLDGEIEHKYILKDEYKNFSNQLATDPPIKSKLLFEDKYCYFTAESDYLYKLDIKNWKIIWKKKIETSLSSPIYHDNKIFIGTEKNLIALNSETGEIMNEYKTNNRWIDYDIRFRKGGAVNGEARIFDNTVYFGSYDYALYAYNIDDENLRWTYKIKHHIDRTRPVVTDDFVCFGADSHHLYLLKKY
ncbi:MAG: PQQ-like beta-propeller repeat protein [Candidatus Mcinerneyibacterium aminivorans]|uniref:PQQ-like beta-propeller repeat protein n=1 Tax=Candidatus Mcinerneyibacterium aminivorans TaxID=2703815 RepID=A0A5D0MLZ4_9BACT|nr:MAG: PQQ-like beta-propeller repeat protein [Candidatus Mcinerneyibacterium aminivorans]